MLIQQMMRRQVDQAAPDETVLAAAQRMLRRNVGTLVVVDEYGEPVGILTDRDIVTRVLATGRDAAVVRVDAAMTREPRTVYAVNSLETALDTMTTGHCRRLPVLDATGKLCGIVSVEDVVRALLGSLVRIDTLLRSQVPKASAPDADGVTAASGS